MDEILDKIADGIVKGADAFSSTAEHIAEKATSFIDKNVARLDRAKLEQNREKEINKLGAMFYEMMRSDNIQFEILRQKCNEIEIIDRQVAAKRAESSCQCNEGAKSDCCAAEASEKSCDCAKSCAPVQEEPTNVSEDKDTQN